MSFVKGANGTIAVLGLVAVVGFSSFQMGKDMGSDPELNEELVDLRKEARALRAELNSSQQVQRNLEYRSTEVSKKSAELERRHKEVAARYDATKQELSASKSEMRTAKEKIEVLSEKLVSVEKYAKTNKNEYEINNLIQATKIESFKKQLSESQIQNQALKSKLLNSNQRSHFSETDNSKESVNKEKEDCVKNGVAKTVRKNHAITNCALDVQIWVTNSNWGATQYDVMIGSEVFHLGRSSVQKYKVTGCTVRVYSVSEDRSDPAITIAATC